MSVSYRQTVRFFDEELPIPSARLFLGASRVAVGAVSLLTPDLAAKVFGADPARSSAWITRLFGSRELLLAALLLSAPDDKLEDVAGVGAVIDAIDAVSSTAEWRAGRISGYTMVSGGLGAVLFAALGTKVWSDTRAVSPAA